MAIVSILLSMALAAATDAEFAGIDSNYDGRVSSGEHEVYVRRLFDEIDDDPDDDRLTRDEIMKSERKFSRHVFVSVSVLGGAQANTEQKILGLDANQDGLVSQTEYLNGAEAQFRKLDLNNNGELSPQEFAAGG